MSAEDDTGELQVGSTGQGVNPVVPTTRKPKSPHYNVVHRMALDELERFIKRLRESDDLDHVVVLIGENVSAHVRRAAREEAREFIPEPDRYGWFATSLTDQWEWEEVLDPLAPAVDVMVASHVRHGAQDTPELRAEVRADLKAAQDSSG